MLTVPELQNEAKKRGLTHKGRKRELLSRLSRYVIDKLVKRNNNKGDHNNSNNNNNKNKDNDNDNDHNKTGNKNSKNNSIIKKEEED